jgi:hypothetical protein
MLRGEYEKTQMFSNFSGVKLIERDKTFGKNRVAVVQGLTCAMTPPFSV